VVIFLPELPMRDTFEMQEPEPAASAGLAAG
jgi:hypothetical protein